MTKTNQKWEILKGKIWIKGEKHNITKKRINKFISFLADYKFDSLYNEICYYKDEIDNDFNVEFYEEILSYYITYRDDKNSLCCVCELDCKVLHNCIICSNCECVCDDTDYCKCKCYDCKKLRNGICEPQ